MGAWIEIEELGGIYLNPNVAPYMGAWIEIEVDMAIRNANDGRSLHGSVD